MVFDLTKRPNVQIGIDMTDYCDASEKAKLAVPVIRAVDDVESAGSGFLMASKRPKILFEGHYFYKLLARHGLAEKASRLEPTICYAKWTKAHYIGREGEYARLAKATELCHQFEISDGIALQSASWGRYQIMAANYKAAGYDDAAAFVEAMFIDEALHLEAFLNYVDHTFLLDELQHLPSNPLHFAALFAHGYNGAGYKRNNYDSKIANAYKRFAAQKIDCSQIARGVHVVEAMPGVRNPNPGTQGFENTSLDDRYVDNSNEDIEIPHEGGDTGSSSGSASSSSSGSGDVMSQKADVITNVATPENAERAKIDAANKLPDTVIDPKGNTGFLAKIWGTIIAIVTGQFILPDFLQKQLSDINLLDLLHKFMEGLWTLRYLLLGSIMLWFVAHQVKDYKLKHQAIQANTDPTKGNIIIKDTPRGLWAWLTAKLPF